MAEKGFGLIESIMEGLSVTGLLLIVALIGIQSAIAIPKITTSRTQAYFEAMKWDLKNLAARQAIYFADDYAYASALSDLRFAASEGVVVTIQATPTGWSGIATHAALGPDEGCAMYVGAAPAPESPTRPERPGELACTD